MKIDRYEDRQIGEQKDRYFIVFDQSGDNALCQSRPKFLGIQLNLLHTQIKRDSTYTMEER